MLRPVHVLVFQGVNHLLRQVGIRHLCLVLPATFVLELGALRVLCVLSEALLC